MAGQDPMAGMPPMGVDPQSWYDLQRRQMTAQLLMQQATTPLQENNMPGQRIRSRLSPIQPIAQMLAAALAGKQMKDLVPAQSRMYQQQMVPFGGAPPADPSQQQDQGGVGPSPPPAAQASSPGAGAGGGAPSPAPAGAAPGAGTDPTGMTGGTGTSLNPTGLPPALAMRMFMTDPAKYGELIAGPNDWRTAVMAAGGDTHRAGRLLLGKLTKEGLIDVRPGGMVVGRNEDGSPFMIRNPSLPEGSEPVFGPNWSIVGATQIPGAAAAITSAEKAKKTGQEEGSIHELETMGGGHKTVFGIPSSMPGAPQDPNATAPSGSTPPNFFAGPPRTPQPGQPTGANGKDMFASMPKRVNYQGNDQFGSDPHSTIMNEKEASREVELREKFGDESDLADQRKAFNSIALDALPNAETGPLADTINQLRLKAQEAGIPEDMIPGWAKVAPTQEMKKSLVRNAIVSLKPNFGGRPAAAEFQVLKEEANPSDKMAALAIKRLLQIDNELADYQKQRANDFDTAMERGGSALRFPTWYSHQRPVQAQMENFLHPASKADVAAEIRKRAAAQQPQPGQ